MENISLSAKLRQEGSNKFHSTKGKFQDRWAAGKNAIDSVFQSHKSRIVWNKGDKFSYDEFFKNMEKQQKPHDKMRDQLGLSGNDIKLVFNVRQRDHQVKEDAFVDDEPIADAPLPMIFKHDKDIFEEMDSETYEGYLDFLYELRRQELGPLAELDERRLKIDKATKDKDNNFKFRFIIENIKPKNKFFIRRQMENGVDVSAFNTVDFEAKHEKTFYNKKEFLTAKRDDLIMRITTTSDKDARLKFWKKATEINKRLLKMKQWEAMKAAEEPVEIKDIGKFFERLRENWVREEREKRKVKGSPIPESKRREIDAHPYTGGIGTLPSGFITNEEIMESLKTKYRGRG